MMLVVAKEDDDGKNVVVVDAAVGRLLDCCATGSEALVTSLRLGPAAPVPVHSGPNATSASYRADSSAKRCRWWIRYSSVSCSDEARLLKSEGGIAVDQPL